MFEYSYVIDCEGKIDRRHALIEVIAVGEPVLPAYVTSLRLETSSSLYRRSGFYRLAPSPVKADSRNVWFIHGDSLDPKGLDRQDPIVRRVYGDVGVSVEDPPDVPEPSPVEVMDMNDRSVRYGARLDVMDFELHMAPSGLPLYLLRRGTKIDRPDLLDLRATLAALHGAGQVDKWHKQWLISRIKPALETAEQLASEG
jgi:hypothetical protein